MEKALFLFFAGLFLSAVLTACDGAMGPSKSLDVTMMDFAFSPNIFTVPAEEQISFSATNNRAITHSFIIMKSGFQVTGHFTDADKPNIFWEVEQTAPGQSVKEMFASPDDPGQY